MGVIALGSIASAAGLPKPGDWVRYRVMRASEWTPAAVEHVTITIGAPSRIEGIDAVWWQMAIEKPDGVGFTVQALSERAPMTTERGEVGIVFSYIFRQQGRPALDYVNEATRLAYLPMFGFRDGLIPTPRSRMSPAGPFFGTGNYLGQAISVRAHGAGGKWEDLGQAKRIALSDDVLIGTARMFRDDGTGKDESGEYRYTELTAEDYDRMIEAGFNIFMVNEKHADMVMERGVFFVKGSFGKDSYPEMLYRSNYWGPAMFTDEPAVRLDTSDCATVYDAANLLRLRNYSYHRMPGSAKLDPRLTQSNAIILMIQQAGFNVGDWAPVQSHVPVWETVHESAFYQLQGGAAGICHEGRYRLADFNNLLEAILGPGAEATVPGMYDFTFCFMRGAARCFGKEWGTAIYGQADYSIAPDAIKHAYDMGAHYIWYWTSDHDHHLPFPQQLELSRILRAHQKVHPRKSRGPQLTSAKVAVAIPDGYICGWGAQWGNPRFRYDKLNEFGVPYGDINAEAFWQMHRLAEHGVDFDCLIDVPEVIERAGYDKIIRIGPDAKTNLPDPAMPAAPLAVTVRKSASPESYAPRPGAPRATAAYVKPGGIRIDGSLADWKNAGWIELGEQFMYEVVHEKWGGRDDLSAQVAFAYDDEAVYIAAMVTDDVMAGSEEGDLIWQNDCLQIGFDPLFNPHPEGSYAADDIEIGFSLVNGRAYAHRWTPSRSGAPGEIPGAEVAIVREGTVTRYEARVPFSSVAPLAPGFPGRCGVNAVVNDSDSALRKGVLGWTSGLADGKNPSRFGVLEFADAKRLANTPPMAFAQVEKTVVKRGEEALLRLDTGAREASDAELTLTVRHNDARTVPSVSTFRIPAGMSRFRIAFDTSTLESDSYRAELSIKTGGMIAIEQSFRFYVLP